MYIRVVVQVMREHEEDAAAVRQVQAAVATTEVRALSKVSPHASCTVPASSFITSDKIYVLITALPSACCHAAASDLLLSAPP